MFDAIGGGRATFGRTLRQYVAAALVWIPATPIPWLLAGRLPIRREVWKRRVPLHLGISLLFGATVHVTIVAVQGAAGLYAAGTWQLFRMGLASLGNQLHLTALLYWVILGARHAWELYGEVRARELEAARLEARLNRATLEALRLQLRPHFLFNALHTINLLWRTGRGEEAQEMLERLSGLLRRFLDEEMPNEIRLERELAMAEDYLAIEDVRFGDRLHLEVHVPDETFDAMVPSFILLPILENAITHGIEPHSTVGRLAIEVERSGDEIRIEVRDDGPGPDEASSDPGHGIGLANVRQRLEAMYGASGRLEVGARPDRGTIVCVHLPFRAQSAHRHGARAEGGEPG